MERELKDQRKSFMSGHSSYAFSAATWCILYLQAKVPVLSILYACVVGMNPLNFIFISAI